eukprot:CAMPEP_0184717718 /NCGR_PEP_ID=MMETSP0314-20130426/7098_1 /TAXON_ID=38298 /ORGANISM="Rhodella maculata, Strain CCMP 736" /LENGTH=315 /DNA_ID=CAMNT_0027181325 /DNA_START=63 /DNA_END=1007 /DNA_ORIENTATION=+
MNPGRQLRGLALSSIFLSIIALLALATNRIAHCNLRFSNTQPRNVSQGAGEPRSIALVSLFTLQEPSFIESSADAKLANKCYSRHKKAFSRLHGYKYFDEREFQRALLSKEGRRIVATSPHMAGKEGRFDKLRFLIHLLDEYPHIEWFLWMDADAVIMNQSIKVEERIHQFKGLLYGTTAHDDDSSPPAQPALITSVDFSQSINTGVMLIHNCPLSLQILRSAFSAPVPASHPWADQRALSLALERAPRAVGRQVLCLRGADAALLQSYGHVEMGEQDEYEWEEGHWILHMPGQDWKTRREFTWKMCEVENGKGW